MEDKYMIGYNRGTYEAVLKRMIEYVIESDVDTCKCCSKYKPYNEYTEEERTELERRESLCLACSSYGDESCKEGIFEFFKSRSMENE